MFAKRWNEEDVSRFVSEGCDAQLLATGEISSSADRYRISLRLWETNPPRLAHEFETAAHKNKVGEAVISLTDQLRRLSREQNA